VEGHPNEAGQARLQMSRHVKVVGLSLVLRGHVPARVLSWTAPDPLASWNTEGTLGRPNGEGRRERCVQVCSTNLDTVDTTRMYHATTRDAFPFR
jgi:hypothetical protein